MERVIILFTFFISISFFSQENEKRLALVIGNANYEKGELKNPVNDARLIASTLDSLNFKVILKENLATKREMTAAIREFGSKRPQYDVAFIYYAGHGVQVNDENFLLPTKETFQEEFDVMDYGVSVQNIMRYLKTQTDQVNILILDACRDNPFESKWNTSRSLKSKGLAKIPPPTGSLIAFSTDSGQTAPDGEGDNSIYTVSLAKNMLLEDISIDQVFRNVRAEVLVKTKGYQRPVEATQLTGKTFYLNPTKVSELLKDVQDLMDAEKYEDARSLIEPIYKKYSKNTEVLKVRAGILIFTDNLAMALIDINKLIEIKPNMSSAFSMRATVLLEEKYKNYLKAEADFTKAIELNPNNDYHYYARGKFYADYLEDYDKAIIDYTKAIELDPTDLKNYYARGLAFTDNQKYNQSLSDYLKIEELDKDKSFVKSNYIYRNIALSLESLKRYDKALSYYFKEIELNPENDESYYYRGEFYANYLEDYDKAIFDYTKAIELDSKDDYNYFVRAKVYYNLDKFERAITDLTKAIELDNESLDYYFLRGLAFERSKLFNRSISDYLKVEELDKDESFSKSEYLCNNIAISFQRLEQFDLALKYYSKEIKFRPNSSEGYLNRANLYSQLKDYVNAEKDYKKAIELEPENDENYYYRGEFYADFLEDYDKAIIDYTKAIELDPTDLKNYFSRGLTFNSNRQYNLALADYLKIEELDKDKSFVKSNYLYNNIAVSFENLEQYDKALEYYTKEIKFRPNYSTGYRNRGDLYAEKIKDYKKAEDDFTKAIDLEPENAWNYYYRGQFYGDYLEDYDKAIIDYTKAIELDSKDSYYYYMRGEVYYRNKKYNNSISDYQKAKELDKDIVFEYYIYSDIAKSYREMGYYDKALFYYNKEIALNEDAKAYSDRAILFYSYLKDISKAESDFKKAISLSPDENNIILKYLNFLYKEEKYAEALKLIKENKGIDLKDPQGDFVAASIYFDLNKPFQAIMYLSSCLEKIKKFSSEGYYISDVNDNKIDLSKVFMMMGDFYKDKDEELKCNYYKDALNYTKIVKIKNKIKTTISNNCD